MANEVDDYSLLVVLYSGEVKSINTLEYFEPDNFEIIIPAGIDIEEDLIKKDLFLKLSREAKIVINFLLNSPDECLEVLKTEKYNRVSVKKFRKLMVNVWNNSDRSKRIIREIKLWLKELAQR